MKNKSLTAAISTVLLTVTIVSIMATSAAEANMQEYLNSTFNIVTTGDSGFYQSQTRGYAIGGGMRAKFDFVNQPLVTFDAPSLKAGCGGIEGRLGAFSYLNFDQIVAKLQMILSAAPAFAFSLALKTLCEACENIISTMEAITNMINQFNVNSCGAAKALVGYAGSLFYRGNANDVAGEPSGSSWYSELSSGLLNVTNKVNKFIHDYSGYYDCAMEVGQNLESCIGMLGKISFIVPFWDSALKEKKTRYEALLPTFRAWFGDFKQQPPKDADNDGDDSKPWAIVPAEKCDQPSVILMHAMVEGEYKYADSFQDLLNHNCKSGDINYGLRTKVGNALINIQDNIINGTDPTGTDLALINSSHIPVWSLLSIATALDRVEGRMPPYNFLTSAIFGKMRELLPYDIAMTAIQDALGSVNKYISQVIANKADTTNDAAVIAAMIEKKDDLKVELDSAQIEYQKKMDEWNKNFAESMKEYKEMKTRLYAHLGNSKLLDSYLFGKGMR